MVGSCDSNLAFLDNGGAFRLGALGVSGLMFFGGSLLSLFALPSLVIPSLAFVCFVLVAWLVARRDTLHIGFGSGLLGGLRSSGGGLLGGFCACFRAIATRTSIDPSNPHWAIGTFRRGTWRILRGFYIRPESLKVMRHESLKSVTGFSSCERNDQKLACERACNNMSGLISLF